MRTGARPISSLEFALEVVSQDIDSRRDLLSGGDLVAHLATTVWTLPWLDRSHRDDALHRSFDAFESPYSPRCSDLVLDRMDRFNGEEWRRSIDHCRDDRKFLPRRRKCSRYIDDANYAPSLNVS